MKQLKGLDLKRARLVPSSVFSGPEEVVNAPGLSLAQRLAILRRWEFDARTVSGFARGSRAASGGAALHYQVQRALDELAGKGGARAGALTTLAAREKARPRLVAAATDSTESPCAPPGLVLQGEARSPTRI